MARPPISWLIAACVFLHLASSAIHAQTASSALDPYRNPDPRARFENIWPSNNQDTQPGTHLFIITTGRPTHRQPCRVQSIDANQLICLRHFGRKPHVFQAKEVVAIIKVGDHAFPYVLLSGGATAASIWGTVALAPICVPCAVVTGVASGVLLYLTLSSGMLADEPSIPSTIVYRAPGQQLHIKLR